MTDHPAADVFSVKLINEVLCRIGAAPAGLGWFRTPPIPWPEDGYIRTLTDLEVGRYNKALAGTVRAGYST